MSHALSKRITEAELRAWDYPPFNTGPRFKQERRLVAEVRRLRGLIVDASGCAYEGDLDPGAIAGLRRVEAEARAIREEQE